MAFGQSERSMGVKLYGSTDLKHGHMDGIIADCHEIKKWTIRNEKNWTIQRDETRLPIKTLFDRSL